MAKDPAFLFYSNDFEAKTKFFTHEQVGIYMRLLITQHQHGHLSKEQILHVVGKWDPKVMEKYQTDENGLYYQERLEAEISKRKAFSESRKINASAKHMQSTSKASVKHMLQHMENENEIENEDRNRKKKFIKPTLEEIILHIAARNYSVDPETFYAYYETNGWRTKNGPVKNWQQCIVTWEKRNKPKQLQQVFGKQAVDSMESLKRFNEKMERKASQQAEIEQKGEIVHVKS